MSTFEMAETLRKRVKELCPGRARAVNVYAMKTYYAALVEQDRCDWTDGNSYTDTFIMRFEEPRQLLEALCDDAFIDFIHC